MMASFQGLQPSGSTKSIDEDDEIDQADVKNHEANDPGGESDISSDISSLEKEDSGIILETSVNKSQNLDLCQAKSPSASLKDGVSDVEMNDAESFVDSAMPSSSLSEPETKSDASPFSAHRVEREISPFSLSKHGESSPTVSNTDSQEAHPSSTGSPVTKRATSEDETSPNPVKCKVREKSRTTGSYSLVEDNSEDSGSEPPHENAESLPDLSTDEEGDNDDDEEASGTGVERILYRQRLRLKRQGRQLSSSDSDASEDDMTEIKSEVDSNESHEDVTRLVTEILNKVPPKPNWQAVPELRRREYGYSLQQSSCLFRERVQGSVQMVKRLRLADSMKYHEGCVNALSFNRIGTLLASGSDDLNIALWNWQRGRPSLIYESGHRSNVFQAKFMPYSGDCHVISCARDGQVRLAELSMTGVCKATRKLAQHRGSAHKLALEQDSPNVFLSCGEDALTYLFDLRDDRPHKLVITKENDKKIPLYSIHSNPMDPRQFCVGGRDHFIRIYDKRKISDNEEGVLKKLCPDHLIDSDIKANVTCACYNYNGKEILGTYNDEDIYLFDNTQSDGANYVHRYMGHRNSATVKGVNFYGPKSEFIVSGSDCGNIYFWDKETEAVINIQEGDKQGVINVLEPHPTLPVLATSGLDHDVKMWVPSEGDLELDLGNLRKTVKKNLLERNRERVTEPEMIGSQMLWYMMHHFRNRARRRMREEGHELSSSDDDESNSDDSDGPDIEMRQCTQS